MVLVEGVTAPAYHAVRILLRGLHDVLRGGVIYVERLRCLLDRELVALREHADELLALLGSHANVTTFLLDFLAPFVAASRARGARLAMLALVRVRVVLGPVAARFLRGARLILAVAQTAVFEAADILGGEVHRVEANFVFAVLLVLSACSNHLVIINNKCQRARVISTNRCYCTPTCATG